MHGYRGGQVVQPPPAPLEKHKAIGFQSNADPDPFVNHQATKAAFNVGPSSAALSGIWALHPLIRLKKTHTKHNVVGVVLGSL